MIGSRRLVIGIGNSGRADDGLGWAFLDAIESMRLDDTDVEYKYQLQIEDADLISQYQEVLFVDASNNQHPDGFAIYPLAPALGFTFSTHALEPAVIVGLCKEMYTDLPECRMLEITGEEWELKIGLSDIAKRNLKHALRSIRVHLPELV